MKCGVVIFPGSNCDHDVIHALGAVLGREVEELWHEEDTLKGCELVVLPGGFSYGDYLRAGALAAQSPVMAAVRRHAERGGLVLGICNGFQILIEGGLLPGALRHNRNLRFECSDTYLRVERDDLPFTSGYSVGQVLRIPIAHSEGRFEIGHDELERLESERRVVFRYVSPEGDLDDAWNINGSLDAIAGLTNAEGNVLGMMPHPERVVEGLLEGTDGLALLRSAVESRVALAS